MRSTLPCLPPTTAGGARTASDAPHRSPAPSRPRPRSTPRSRPPNRRSAASTRSCTRGWGRRSSHHTCSRISTRRRGWKVASAAWKRPGGWPAARSPRSCARVGRSCSWFPPSACRGRELLDARRHCGGVARARQGLRPAMGRARRQCKHDRRRAVPLGVARRGGRVDPLGVALGARAGRAGRSCRAIWRL